MGQKILAILTGDRINEGIFTRKCMAIWQCGQNKVAVITMLPYYRDGRKTGFHCIYINLHITMIKQQSHQTRVKILTAQSLHNGIHVSSLTARAQDSGLCSAIVNLSQPTFQHHTSNHLKYSTCQQTKSTAINKRKQNSNHLHIANILLRENLNK